MAYRRKYSDGEKAEALIKLAVNRHNILQTAEEIGVPETTLRRWANSDVGAKKGVFNLLERAIERMLMVIPTEWTGNSWAVALGILIDKYQLMQGEPTSRSESVFRNLQDLTDDERSAVIANARELIDSIGNDSTGRGASEETG